MNKYYILPAAAAIALMASCADEFNPEYTVEKPVDFAKIAELADYKPLKEYINREAHPGFKLGAALDANAFSEKTTNEYFAAVTNFDEVVAGNAMKYASVVDNKGNMDFSNVSKFVSAAVDADLAVYGHTLVWHSQQQPKYLTSLIADKPMPKPEGGATSTQETVVAEVTYNDGPFPFYPMGCEPPVEDGALHFSPNGEWSQFFITNAIGLGEGTYKAVVTIKAGKEGSMKLTAQNGWGGDAQQMDGNVKVTEEWADVEVKYNDTFVGGNYDFILKPEMFDAEVWVKGLKIVKIEEVAAGPELHPEFQQVAKTTYTDGPFPFYPMGCEPPVENGALHFTPTGEWSQFFITNAIALEAGEYQAIVRIKASKEGSMKLTAQNGWGGDAQQMDGNVKVGTEWADVEVKYPAEFVGGNYDFILKPEMFDGEVWVESLTVGTIKMVAGPVAKEVAKTTYTDGGFPFYPMGCEPPVENGALHFTPTGEWSQFFITNAIGLEAGEYTAVVEIKASKEGSMKLTAQNGWGGDAQQMDGNVKVGTDWANVEVKYPAEFVGGNYDFILKPEMFDGEVWVKSLTIFKWEEAAGGEATVEVEKTITEKKPTLVVTSSDMVEYAWDTQFWIMTDGYNAGDSYEFSADVRADIKASASTQIHNGPGEYVHYACVGEVPFTPDWETYTSKGTLDQAGKSIAFNLNDQAKGTKYYFRNISFKVNGVEKVKNGDLSSDDNSAFFSKESRGDIFNTVIQPQISYTKMVASNTIPLTAEEKDSIISIQLDRWIAGMMEACEGNVKAWDLANELISGGADRVDGRYALQHGEEGDDVNFYWQDYLGDEKVVRFAVASARQHYAESLEEKGGDDGKLKLFINDYNLESDWDDNGKLKSLIEWINVWESDGVTKIDGIGSQMHISYYANAKTMESKKAHIEQMLRLMSASGKLVRISELDMEYIDASGNSVHCELTTDEQEQEMEQFYQWIIEKYFEIVPVAQQYGICQWCLTDSQGELEDKSGWRPGRPTGIWDRRWNRKYVYRGWVNGLQK